MNSSSATKSSTVKNFFRNSLALFTLVLDAQAEVSPEQRQFFEAKIRPVLVNQCYDCHSAKKTEKVRFDQPITAVQATGIVSIFRAVDTHPAHKPLPERTLVESYGGQVHLIDFLPDHSTTQLIQRIRALPRI